MIICSKTVSPIENRPLQFKAGEELPARDSFCESPVEKEKPVLDSPKILELQRINNAGIDTDWGFGSNENAFNRVIQKAAADKWGDYKPSLPPILVKSMIARESAFNPSACSPTGYLGLMQLGKEEAVSQGLSLDPVDERLNPEKNINAGVGIFKIKHSVVSNPLSFYPNETWAKSVATFYGEKGEPTEQQKWFLSLAAYNGGGGTVLRSMNHAMQKGKDPREWKNLVEPKDSPKDSPLYKGITEIYGDKYALPKYNEMARYPVLIMQRAGLIDSATVHSMDVFPSDYEKGDDVSIPVVNVAEMIQKIKSGELKSDKELSDPLPAVLLPGTREVVDESRDSVTPPAPGKERTFGHNRKDGALFDKSGNWADIGTAVAANQLSGMSDAQMAEFTAATGVIPADITPGEASIMLLSPTEDWDKMDAPKPPVTYKEIDYSKIGNVKITPKWIVMHYTGGVKDSAKGVWNWFDQKKGVPSTQFIVSREGDIIQTMPETQKCVGTLDFNSESVQIEVCGNFRLEKETEAEFNTTVALVKYLQKKYKIPDTQIISHRQVDNNFNHVGRKPDPGFRFMNRLYDSLQ
jgi:soluble lytic murein transglycosylase-like protein